MSEYTYTKLTDSDRLTAEILAQSLPLSYINVFAGDQLTVNMTRDLTSEEVTSLETVVTNHNSSLSLAETKALYITNLDKLTKAYIISKYDLERQNSLALIRGDARADGLTNRFAYIQQLVDWINSVLTYHYGLSDYVNSRTTVEEVNAIVPDYVANTIPDPDISIRTSFGILD